MMALNCLRMMAGHPLCTYPAGCVEFGWCADEYIQISVAPGVGGGAGRADQVITALGIVSTEKLHGGAVEISRVPLALDDVYFVTAMGQDEIKFMAAFGAPVADGGIWETGLQVFENKVFPERPEVIRA